MGTKSTEREAARGASVKEARHRLHVVPAGQPNTKSGVPANESLRELLESFKWPQSGKRQPPDDDDLLPAT